MCEQCLVKPRVWKDVFSGWHLIQATVDGSLMKAGQWGLVESNDPPFVWSVDPKPDPTVGMTEEEEQVFYDTNAEEAAALVQREKEFRSALSCLPLVGWRLVNACIAAGFDTEKYGSLAPWLLDYLGRYIQAHEPIIEE